MKTVTIFKEKYQVTQHIYNVLLSVRGKNDCINTILYFGQLRGDIIKNNLTA